MYEESSEESDTGRGLSDHVFDFGAAYSDGVKTGGVMLAVGSPSPEYSTVGVSVFGMGVAFDAFQGYAEQYFESEDSVDNTSSGRYRELPGIRQYHDIWYDFWDSTDDDSVRDELEP